MQIASFFCFLLLSLLSSFVLLFLLHAVRCYAVTVILYQHAIHLGIGELLYRVFLTFRDGLCIKALATKMGADSICYPGIR